MTLLMLTQTCHPEPRRFLSGRRIHSLIENGFFTPLRGACAERGSTPLANQSRSAQNDNSGTFFQRSLIVALLAICFCGGDMFAQERTLVVDRIVGEFVSAVSLASSGAGDIYVVDAGANQLQKFSSDGRLMKILGGKGWGSLEFDRPLDVCAAFPLDIFVVDENNRRVQRFDRPLNFVQSLSEDNVTPPRGGKFYPRASALSTIGELFVLESDAHRVIKFTTQLLPEREFGSYNAGAGSLTAPVDIVLTDDGLVRVADGMKIFSFDTYGNYMTACTVDTSVGIIAISAFRGGFLCTFQDKLSAFLNDGTPLWTIRRAMAMGMPAGELFRDALVLGSSLLVLTERHLAVCRIAEK
jgi:hypothetical protein